MRFTEVEGLEISQMIQFDIATEKILKAFQNDEDVINFMKFVENNFSNHVTWKNHRETIEGLESEIEYLHRSIEDLEWEIEGLYE